MYRPRLRTQAEMRVERASRTALQPAIRRYVRRGAVTSIAFSADSTIMAVSAADCSAAVFDAISGSLLHEEKRSVSINSVSLSSDARALALGDASGSVVLLRWADDAPLRGGGAAPLSHLGRSDAASHAYTPALNIERKSIVWCVALTTDATKLAIAGREEEVGVG